MLYLAFRLTGLLAGWIGAEYEVHQLINIRFRPALMQPEDLDWNKILQQADKLS